MDRLPHTGPARLPGRLLHLDPGTRVVAERAFAPGDACLNDEGFLPTVLVVELIAQVGGFLIDDSDGGPGGYGVLAGVKRMHMHGTARAGETVEVECRLTRRMGDLYMIEGRMRSGDREVGHGTIQVRRVRSGPA